MNEVKDFDVLIIGAGPAGLTAAIYTSRANLKVCVIGESFDSQLAKAGIVENYPGFSEGIQGMDLSTRMIDQAQKYGAFIEEVLVKKITKEDDSFLVEAGSELYKGKVLILATGAKYRELGFPGEKEFYQRGVSYCEVCDGPLYRRKNVDIVGHGNNLAKAAVFMSPIAKRLSLVIIKEELICEAVYKDRLAKMDNVEFFYGAEPLEVIGGDTVEKLKIKIKTGEEKTLEISGIFVTAGTVPNSELAKSLGLELTKNDFVKVKNKTTLETEIPGCFVAGDLTGGRRQIATAIGEGASAGISATKYIQSLPK
ncbi:MAG: NAD(P)/FAD-dependent oxidoreductase [Candidatus Wukongarchaeota archaeon]|nr:FAD-dependent oxidoreductase [Candidatus Wukongarchaeota archaeon]